MERKLRFAEGVRGKKGIEIRYGSRIYTALTPVEIEVRETEGKDTVYTAGYDSVTGQDGVWHAVAAVETVHKSVLEIRDRYVWEGAELVISRAVTVQKSDGHDVGFSTSFSLGDREQSALAQYEVFIPGIWYRKNDHVVKNAFGSDPADRYFYMRTTRMALPYVEIYHPESRSFLVMKQISPIPDTGKKETGAQWEADESFQYLSMGIRAEKDCRICCRFPGSEGEKNYIDPNQTWAKRSHPFKNGIRHQYSVSVLGGEGNGSYEAMRKVWRYFYEKTPPPRISADMERVYEESIRLLDTYCQEYNGAVGLPFWAKVPEGNVCDISFQMGFVGQQTMCAYQLMRYGFARQDARKVEKGERMIDFWVKNAAKTSALPRVWYDVFPASFKMDYPSYTRTVADGMEGILAAFVLETLNGRQREEWKAFCVRYGDWMTENQNGDGSWYRAYDEKGSPVHEGKFNTSNVIRFLVNLYWLTGERKYRDGAVKAGEFCYRTIYLPMQYVGGTADNDNTIDKEAGMIAVYAFLSLFEMEGDRRFLEAAKGAADFCETWTYAWEYPVRPYKGNAVFGKVGMTGLSLIATGHSHADVMMAYMSFEYYKLWLYTKEEHYLEFARFIHENTKQTMDWDRKLGHAYPGLVEESGEMALQYHNGLGKWLPWCTIAEMEPLSRFEEKFGYMDLETILAEQEEAVLRQPVIQDPAAGKKVRSSWLGSWDIMETTC